MDNNYLYLVQLLAISGIFSVYHYCCLRQNGKHRINRLVILSSIVFSLVLPLIQFPVAVSNQVDLPYVVERAIESNYIPAEAEPVTGIEPTQQMNFTIEGILLLVFILISSAMFLRLLISLWILLKKITQTNGMMYQHCRIISDDSTNHPFSFFTWIFIPVNIRNDEVLLQAILAHELTHAQHWHSLDKLFTSLLKTVLWWNPFFYYLERQLLLTHEYEADKAAAKQTGIKKYAEALIHHIFPGTPSNITHSFFQSPIKLRVMMLFSPTKQPARHWIFPPLIGLTLLLFSTSFKKTSLPAGNTTILKVVIDAGHGGMDNGASLLDSKEKDINLALAKAIQQKANGTNISISLTREGDELPVAGNIKESLKKRVAIVQETDADVMVSLHVGKAPPRSTKDLHGIHIFIAGKNAESAKMSKPLATALLNSLTGGHLDVLPTIQQHRTQSIYILDNNVKPVVMLNVGFISNSKDLEILSNADEINMLAERILLGLQQYASKEKP